MKPPKLPGTEKFRFCDKKFDQQHHYHHDETLGPTFDESKIIMKTSGTSDDFLYDLSENDHHSLSSKSFLFHNSNTTIDGTFPTNQENVDQKCSSSLNDDSISTSSISTATTFDDIISQVNNASSGCDLDDYHSHRQLVLKHYGQHSKRKPNLPISSRLTSRVFNLTSYIRHLSVEADVGNDAEVDIDEESDSFCTLADNVKDLAYSSLKAKTTSNKSMANNINNNNSKQSESSVILSTRNRSQKHQEQIDCGSALSRSPTPNSLVSHNGCGSDTSSESIVGKHSPPTSGEDELDHLCIPQMHRVIPGHHHNHHHHHHHNHLHHHHHHHHHGRLATTIMSSPSHASLMSDESSSSMSYVSTNRDQEYDQDSLLRSSSCSPMVEHWAKTNTSVGVSTGGGGGVAGLTRGRLSTLSHSSWE